MGYIERTQEGKVAIFSLNHPPANALSSAIIDELDYHLEVVEEDVTIKVIVIHGTGRFFSAGADIKEFTQVSDSSHHLSQKGQEVFNRIENFSKPIIAAIHGAALGGGLELAMACHIRLAEKGSKFGLPELNLGLIPGFGGTQRLSRLVGIPKATEMMLTSDPLKAEEALNWGLINHVVSEGAVLHEALTLGAKIAEKSAISVRSLFACLREARQGTFEKGLEREASGFADVFLSDDAKEGITAFIEKRKPVFKDK